MDAEGYGMIRRHHRLDMLNGPLFPNILRFAVPLILANVLQLLYNAADMVVVGRFAPDGEAALAAVGAIAPVSGILINIGGGLAVGVSVKVAQHIGADDRKSVFGVVHTGVAVGIILGAVLAVLGIVLADPLLHLMGTPEDVMEGAIRYMRIRMAGQIVALPFALIAATFRAAGNTTRPTAILCLTGVLNVILNLVFVIGCGMGIEGVGLATLSAEIVNLVLGVWSLCKTEGIHKLYLREIKIYKKHLLDILKIGVPTVIQSTMYNVSNVFVQASLNTFPSFVGAGNIAASNLIGFVNTAMGAIGQASVTFMGQNIGAGNYRRVGRVNTSCTLLTVMIGSLGVVLALFGPHLIQLYNTNPQVIEAGMTRLQVEGCLMFLYFTAEVQIGGLRAMGRSVTAMALSIFGSVGVQLMWILLVFGNCPAEMDMLMRLRMLYMCYPVSFLVNVLTTGTAFMVFYRRLLKQSPLAK